jgi:RNA-binding protein
MPKYLRGLGHQLKPLIIVGDAGLSESVLAEYESTLDHHELIKVRVRVGDRDARDAIIEKLCNDSAAVLIQRIGNVALLFRQNLKKKPEKRIRVPSRPSGAWNSISSPSFLPISARAIGDVNEIMPCLISASSSPTIL